MVRCHSEVFRAFANAFAVKVELVAKLQNEITMEDDLKEDEDLSANIKEYLENSAFEVNTILVIKRSQRLTASSSRTSPATRRLS
jgi:hypothetical protein